ncbi:sensor histidine kinase [Flavobacterium sp.]|uniref:sensor histidine kinase n=1 Tax=Flavobacterium sp. TaxID=239 RepID=UPI0037C0864D
MNPNYLKKLKFQDRKVLHYTLFACIILLQFLAILIWYNETANEDKLDTAFGNIAQADRVTHFTGKINSALLLSQDYFNDYITNKNQASLDKYLASLAETVAMIDSLKINTQNNGEFQKIIQLKNKTQQDILKIKATIDTIVDRQKYPNAKEVAAPFHFDEFDYNKILDSIKTNTFIKVDSISKKGLLARLIAAFSGKIEIQKEQLNTIVTMKYKDKVKTGTVEEQMKNVFLTTNQYYESEFKKLKEAFLQLRAKDLELIKLNNDLLMLSQNTLPVFNIAADDLKWNSQQNLKDQFKTNRAIRSYSIVAIIFLMFLISLLLFGFTRLAFAYEKRLTVAQEKIRQNLNFKNRIMGMISHEIRSPLNLIALYSRKISQTVKEPEVQESFKSIQFTSHSLLLLSNQILEYSKDEQYQPKLKNSNFKLKNELTQILSAMHTLVESKGNKLKVTMAIEEEEVYADATKIHQLFYNIIGNANKFTEKGTITVAISQENPSDFETNLKVAISDNGRGIAKNDLDHIFDSYYQGTVSGAVNDLGIGLGLNICKEIVTLFEGNITVSSEENKGTTIEFNLILSKA